MHGLHTPSGQQQIEEIDAAPHGDEYADGDGVVVHMLHQELPRHQDDHPEEHRPRHQLGVAIGSQQLPGEVGHDEPHEGDGPHHRWGGHRKPVAHWNQ